MSLKEPVHPKFAMDHDSNRARVCAPCGKKISVSQLRTINEKECALIMKFVNPLFDVHNPIYPSGLCSTCRVYLSKANMDNLGKLPTMLNYEQLVLPKTTRSNNNICNCNICLTARSKAKNKRIFGDIITQETGLFGSSHIDKLPSKMDKENRKTVTICEVCKQETGRGISHTCSVANSSTNVVSHVLTLPNTQQEQVITSLLKIKTHEGNTQEKTLILSTKGSKARVQVNPAKSSTGPLFTHESLDKLQIYLNNISNKHMQGIAHWLRVNSGRKSVKPGFANHLTKKGQKLSELYNLTYLEVDVHDGKRSERPVVWANSEKLLHSISDERGYVGKLFVKVMADGGQGFLKVCLTILPENYSSDDESVAGCGDFSPVDGVISSSKRSAYKDGGGIGSYKLTSVKRVLILCIVPDCVESHANMKQLFDITCLNDISFLFVADFKLLLTCLGCQTATASFPCPYCLIPLKEITSSVKDEGLANKFEDRTFGSLAESQVKFVNEYGSQRKLAKLCNSTVESPLMSELPSVLVLDKCPPEELHCLQGFVNHTFFHGLVKTLGSEEKALKFPKALNLISKDYHGKCFEGNACRKMIQKSDKMMEKCVLGDTSPLIVLPYVRAYKAMDKLVNSCFSCKKVTEDVVPILQELIESYMDLGLSVTLKMHVIFCHLLPALCNPALEGRGLGYVSGQAGESIHHEFKIFWNKLKINSLDNDRYGENLKRAVIEFSSKHI